MAAVKCLIILALLKIAASIPAPNPDHDHNIEFHIDQTNTQLQLQSGCCCKDDGCHCKDKEGSSTTKDPPPSNCWFGGLPYPDKAYLVEACFLLQCIDGTWECTGIFDHHCGNCTFGGEPLIYTFDTLDNAKPISTNKNLTGEYIMTHAGLGPEVFGVHGHFTDKPDGCDAITDCINGVTYHEPDIWVTITLDAADGDKLKVFVTVGNGPVTRVSPVLGGPVLYIHGGDNGPILVFAHNHIDGGGQNCMNVIGTKGLTVALCEKSESDNIFPWAYIYAMPHLESNPSPSSDSQLHGLCNTWSGENQDCFTLYDGKCTADWHRGTAWDVIDQKWVAILRNEVAHTWKV